jgi:putative NADPH-quinone reductase
MNRNKRRRDSRLFAWGGIPAMSKRIAIIQGHPDPAGAHFGHALADAYAEEATAAGHEVKRIEVARIQFPWLQRKEDWDSALPASLQESQAAIGWANHLVFFFPLWLGTLPAILSAFLEQVLRPGFAFTAIEGGNGRSKRALTGKSARIVVTMGMPAVVYRWYFLAHGVKGLERNVLKFCGIRPVRETLIGRVEKNDRARLGWLAKLRALGREGR